jgi:TonB family protein
MTFALLVTAMLALGDNSLNAARELYASAAYEDALTVLNTLPASLPAEEIRTAAQYRAMCLLALGRSAEADTAIAAVIGSDPTYRPAADVSPRVRAAFTDVRRRMVPAIIQQWYTLAKAQYDRHEFAAAAGLFTQILQVMKDPEVEPLAAQPPLADVRTLAAGFRDLAESAIGPAPLPASPVAAEAAALAAPAAPAPVLPRIYTSADSNVVPPIVIRQVLPPFPGPPLMGKRGVIEVVVDENGGVESAVIRQAIAPQYDKVALASTRSWRYQPATVNGVPVKYRKSIQVNIRVPARPDREEIE